MGNEEITRRNNVLDFTRYYVGRRLCNGLWSKGNIGMVKTMTDLKPCWRCKLLVILRAWIGVITPISGEECFEYHRRLEQEGRR